MKVAMKPARRSSPFAINRPSRNAVSPEPNGGKIPARYRFYVQRYLSRDNAQLVGEFRRTRARVHRMDS